MGKVKVAIVGVGNCCSALIQGVHFYENARKGEFVPGLLHADFGGYHVKDIRFVAAFDIDSRKVGTDLSNAINSKPNNTITFYKVPHLNVDVSKGPTLDGVGKYVKDVIKIDPNQKPVDVSKVLKDSGAEIVVNYLPVGSDKATQYYAQQAIDAGCAFVNCIPSFIASEPKWQKKFIEAKLPVAGDDVMSQVGATVVHKTLIKLLVDRGAVIDESYQLNIGGDTDFQNMIDEDRLASKRKSKTSAVQALVPYKVPLHIGPSDFVPFLENTKIMYVWIKGRYFGNTPFKMDVKLEVLDSPNSGGIVIDAIRATKLGLDRGISGPLVSISSYAFKHPPRQQPYAIAKEWVEMFIENKRDR